MRTKILVCAMDTQRKSNILIYNDGEFPHFTIRKKSAKKGKELKQ